MVTRREKERSLTELEDKFRRAQAAVLADYMGLTVAEISYLRKIAREAGVELEVVKNTLAALATRRAGIEGLDGLFSGPTAVAFGYDDPISPAKVIDRFSREKREVPFKGGYLAGKVLGPGEVKNLAVLPGRQELLGTVVSTLQAPIAGFQRVLAGNLRGLVVALGRIAEKRAAAG
ncbi:MAG: 50S ribosomal protein L10 [Bacillota bacterium]|nr:MAG: 50S ribosomal protein L10 [Bacillota bacterium]